MPADCISTDSSDSYEFDYDPMRTEDKDKRKCLVAFLKRDDNHDNFKNHFLMKYIV